MLPDDKNLNIRPRTEGYNNEIFVSDSGFSLGRNDTVNSSAQEKISHKKAISLKHGHKGVLSKHTSAREEDTHSD